MAAPKGNKFSVGYGRPSTYNNVDDLINAIEEYFTWIEGEFHEEESVKYDPDTDEEKVVIVKVWDRAPEPATITGLALFLGFDSKSTFYEYEKKPSFSYPIKRARMIIENTYEERLHGDKPTGAIFALKNMGWEDKTKQEHTGKDGADLIPPTKMSDDELRKAVESILDQGPADTAGVQE